jgi:predicted ester cyclase
MSEPVYHPVIRQYYEYYNARRFQEAGELFAHDAVIEHAPYGRLQRPGGVGYIESAERSVVAFPDAHIETLDVKAHGDSVFDVELLASGTHLGVLDLGAYGRFEPTGLHVHVRHREVLEIRDGLIRYASVTLDVNDLVAQLIRGPA